MYKTPLAAPFYPPPGPSPEWHANKCTGTGRAERSRGGRGLATASGRGVHKISGRRGGGGGEGGQEGRKEPSPGWW